MNDEVAVPQQPPCQPVPLSIKDNSVCTVKTETWHPSYNSITHYNVLFILPLKQFLSLFPPLNHYSLCSLFSHWEHCNSLLKGSCQPTFHVAAPVTLIQFVSNCVLPLLKTLLCLGIRVA